MIELNIEEEGNSLLKDSSSRRHFFSCRTKSVSYVYNYCIAALVMIVILLLLLEFKDYIRVLLLWLESQEHWIIYSIYMVLFTLVSFPFTWGYTFLVISAGYLFGIGWGVSTVIVSANIGVAVSHLIMRRYYSKIPFSSAILNNAKVTAILNVISGQNAFKVTAIARITPIPFGLQNVIFAVSQINNKEYFVASFFGLLPAQFIYVYIGSSLRSMEEVLSDRSSKTTGFIVLVQILILILMMFYIVSKARHHLNTLAGATLTQIQVY